MVFLANLGDCLIWSGRLLHWSNRNFCNIYDKINEEENNQNHSRIALSIGCSYPKFENKNERSLPTIIKTPSSSTNDNSFLQKNSTTNNIFLKRLFCIGVQMWTYNHRIEFSKNDKDLLEQIEEFDFESIMAT